MRWVVVGIVATLAGWSLVTPAAAEDAEVRLTSFAPSALQPHGRLSGPAVEGELLLEPQDAVSQPDPSPSYAPIGRMTSEDVRRQARRLFAEEEQLQQLGASSPAAE